MMPHNSLGALGSTRSVRVVITVIALAVILLGGVLLIRSAANGQAPPSALPAGTQVASGPTDELAEPAGPTRPAPRPEHQWTVHGVLPPAPGPGDQMPPQQVPGHLEIPSLGISAPLESARIEQGEFVVPPPTRVGVHRSGTGDDLDSRLAPGPGTLLASGHVSWNDELGVLHELHRIEPGALIRTSDGTGRIETWRAVELRTLPYDRLPEDLLDATGSRRLVLVTCAGPVVEDAGSRVYAENLLVTAVPASRQA